MENVTKIKYSAETTYVKNSLVATYHIGELEKQNRFYLQFYLFSFVLPGAAF